MATEPIPTTPRDGLALLPLDDDTVVFCAQTQRLAGLNPTATAILRGLQAGQSPADLAHALATAAGLGTDQAQHWVATTLAALRTHGMLAGCDPTPTPADPLADARQAAAHRIAHLPPLGDFTPAAERHYRLLGTSFRIRYAHPAQIRLVDSILGHLAAPNAPTPHCIIDLPGEIWSGTQMRTAIYRDGQPVGQAERLSYLGPQVKAAVWQAAVNAHDFLLYIHAGVVGTGRACVLLPAAPGSGKSSLTAALVHRGYTYFSDEVALIEPATFRVPPVPLAICVKKTGWNLMAEFHPAILDLPLHRREDAKVVRYLPPPAHAAHPAPVRHIIFPRYTKDAPTTLAPITRAAALGRLMDECMALRGRLDRTTVGQLVHWIAGIDCFDLTFSSLDAAATAVARVIGRFDPPENAIQRQNVSPINLDGSERSR